MKLLTNDARRALARTLVAVAVTIVSMGTSCREANPELPNVLIPREDTAREQFVVAEMQYQQALGVYDPKVRAEEMRKAIVAYKAVEDRFPNDSKYTPVSALLIGNIYQDLEDYEKAVAQYKHCLESYPNDTEVRISSLYGTGESLDELGQPEEAQTYYKLLIDEFEGNSDPKVREMVGQAQIRYRQIRLLGKE